MKRKGVLLITVLILFAVLVILSVSIMLFTTQSNDKMASNVSEEKAYEIAYAGYSIMEKYIVEYEEIYINDNLGSGDTYSTTVSIPYNDGSVSKEVNIDTKATLYEGYLQEVIIKAKASFGEVESSYSNTIYFEDPYVRPKSVFPYNNFSLDQNPIDSPSNSTADSLGLIDRMAVDSVPTINAEHINWILSNSKTSSVTINTDSNGKVTESDIKTKIEELKSKSDTDKSKSWQVIYINNTTSKFTTIYLDGTMNINNTRIHTFDFDSLGNDEETTNLIFLSNRDIKIAPYWEAATSESTYLNSIFPNSDVSFLTGALYEVIGGDMYFISYGGGSYSAYDANRIGVNVSVYNKYNKSLSEIGQITIASTLNHSGEFDIWAGNHKNLFVYYPNSKVEITDNSEIVSTTLYERSNYACTYGGVVAKSITWISSAYKDEYVGVEWRGDPELLGYTESFYASHGIE